MRREKEESYEMSLDSDESFDDSGENYGTDNQLGSEDVFSLVLSRVCRDEEQFGLIVDALVHLSNLNLAAETNKAHKNRDAYWTRVQGFVKVSDSKAQRFFDGYKDGRDNDNFTGIQKMLWDSGVDSVRIGTNRELSKDDDISPALRDYYDDGQLCVQYAHVQKRSFLVNVYDNVLRCLSIKEMKGVKTNLDKEEKVNLLLDDFEGGLKRFKLSAEKFKMQKEPGVALPHTLSPSDWLAEATARLLVLEFGGVLVTFDGADESNINRISESNYLMVSPDETSPYKLECSPAIFQDVVEESSITGMEVWIWRRRVAEAKARARGYFSERLGVGPEEKSQHINDDLMEIVRSEGGVGSSVKWSGCLGAMRGALSKKLGMQFVIRCFKRHFSKKSEVISNSDYIHVVKRTVAQDVEFDSYTKILLPDNMSVVLIPGGVWRKSKFLKAQKGEGIKKYKSKAGIQLGRPNVQLDLFHVLFSLSQTREMFRKLKAGEVYDPVEFSKRILAVIDEDGRAFVNVLGSAIKSANKKKILQVFVSCVQTSIVGLIIQANSTRKGKRSADTQARGGGLQYLEADYGDLVDYETETELALWDDLSDDGDLEKTGGEGGDASRPQITLVDDDENGGTDDVDVGITVAAQAGKEIEKLLEI